MARKKRIEDTAQTEKAIALYDRIKPRMIAYTQSGEMGLITDKFMSEGNLPIVWVQRGGEAYPTAEPVSSIESVEQKPFAVIAFSGGGGVECGLKAAGIEPFLSVEFNPEKPDLSNALSDYHEINFRQCKVKRQTIQECAAEEFRGFPQEPDLLWASPMCSNFSLGKTLGNDQESEQDIEAARAVVKCLKAIRPRYFILENVPAYQKSDSWKQLEETLPLAGYRVFSLVLDLSDFGVPQKRKRFIAWASRDDVPALPEPTPWKKKVGWFEAIADLIPDLPSSELLKGQQEALDEFLGTNPPEPVLILRIGRGMGRIVPSSEPAKTVMRSHFTDGDGANRNRFADIWLPGGTVKAVSIECVKRLQTFPDWYELPEETGLAGSILGYAVPPLFVEQLVKPIVEKVGEQGVESRGEVAIEAVEKVEQPLEPLPASPYTILTLSEIHRDGGTQPRAKLDLSHVAALVEVLEDGGELDPVTVFYDGSEYWLADGFHRCKAHEEFGQEEIPCVVVQGTLRDAVLFSVGANAEHKAVKPRSREDKRRAVTMLLNDPEWQKWSNREIARVCKVDEKTVRKVRENLIDNSVSADIRTDNHSQLRTYTTKHGTVAQVMVGGIRDTADEPETEPVPQSEALPLPPVPTHSQSLVADEPPATEYLVGFLSNINRMTHDQLREVRKQIDRQLDQSTILPLRNAVETIKQNVEYLTPEEVEEVMQALSSRKLVTGNGNGKTNGTENVQLEMDW